MIFVLVVVRNLEKDRATLIYGMYYLHNMTPEEEEERGKRTDNIIDYLLSEGIVEYLEKDEITISGKGILIYKILGEIIEKDEVDID